MLSTNPPAPTATLPAERDIAGPADAAFPSSAPVPPLSSTPLLLNFPSTGPHLDPSLLSLKSAAFSALAEIFAAKDADFREKRLAASIVFKYAASVEPRTQRTRSASEGPSSTHPDLNIDDDQLDSDLEDSALRDFDLDESEPERSNLKADDSLRDSDDSCASDESSESNDCGPSDDSDGSDASGDPKRAESNDPLDFHEGDPAPAPPAIPHQWTNQLRDDEVNLSPFVADPPKIPRHITDNHHVQHLQRLSYNHGYWSGFHNYKGTQRPPYPITYAAPAPGHLACNPKSPLGLVRPALANASLAADLIARSGTAHPPD